MTPTIIFLNGTSSSGKTSIVKALQERLQDPFLDIGIDRFIFMLPKRYLNRSPWDNVLGKAVQAGTAGMHHAIAAAARQGNNVIADHVFVEKAWVDECTQLFGGMNAYLIGVQCPLEILEQRERTRQDRTLGQARLQYDVVHQYTCYDLEVDTSVLSPEECAQKIIERLDTPPRPFRQLRRAAQRSRGGWESQSC